MIAAVVPRGLLSTVPGPVPRWIPLIVRVYWAQNPLGGTMGGMRMALATGALLLSIPVMAQPSRYGQDRSRTDRGGEARGGRQDPRGGRQEPRGGRQEPRGERQEPRGERQEPRGERQEPRGERGPDRRDDGRVAPRGGDAGRVDPRSGGGRIEPRGGDPRTGAPNWTRARVERRDEPRIAVRPPVIINRYDHRAPRVVPPPVRYSTPVRYRYGDRDFRHRDVLTITTWFRALPPARLTAYGYYGPSYGGIRYVFRPGLFISLAVYGQLSVLPYELELELGELPWYLERRLYGNTVLVVDTRTRLIVDIYDLDY